MRIPQLISKSLLALCLLSVLCLGVVSWQLSKDLHFFQKKMKKMISSAMKTSISAIESDYKLPKALQKVPFAEKDGLVLETKTIPIRNVTAPYNASLVEHEGGYLIFFRYDVLTSQSRFPFFTYIGCAQLNANLEQSEKEFCTIDTGSQFSEDPRAVRINDEIFLTYNDLIPDSRDERTIRIAKLDSKTLQPRFVTELDLQQQHIEKNWTPFCYNNSAGKAEIYFEYELQPRKLFKLSDPQTNSLERAIFPDGPRLQTLHWPKNWGVPSGGTAPHLVDGQYLAFFHSRIRDEKGRPWYVMGAYTFEAHPPFKVTAISKYPILFKGMYETYPVNSASQDLRAIYPCGFALGKKEGKDVVHVSCGENDCAIKIVTIDKEVLYKSLKKI